LRCGQNRDAKRAAKELVPPVGCKPCIERGCRAVNSGVSKVEAWVALHNPRVLRRWGEGKKRELRQDAYLQGQFKKRDTGKNLKRINSTQQRKESGLFYAGAQNDSRTTDLPWLTSAAGKADLERQYTSLQPQNGEGPREQKGELLELLDFLT